MAEGAGFLPPVVAKLMGDIGDFKTKMGEAKSEMGTTASNGSQHFNQLAAVGKAAFLTMGVAAVGFAAISIKAALEGEAAHARLATAIHNAGPAFTDMGRVVEENTGKFAKLGIAHDQLESAIAKLVPVTKSSEQAMSLAGLAADVAAGRHMSLDSATQLLVKVQTGHVALLGKLGIATKDASGATITQQAAIQKLTDLYGGAGQRQAETFSGKIAALKAEAQNLTEKVGNALIPVIETLISDTVSIVNWFEQHRTAAIALGVVIGGPLVAAMVAYAVVQARAFAENIAGYFTTFTAGATEMVQNLLFMAGAEETATGAASTMWIAVLGPIAIAGLVVAGIAKAFFGFAGGVDSLSVNMDKLAHSTIPEVTSGLSELQKSWSGSFAAEVSMKAFNKALDSNPELAQRVLLGMENIKNKSPEMEAAVKTARAEWDKHSHALEADAAQTNMVQAATDAAKASLEAAHPTIVQAAKAVNDHATALQKEFDAVWGNVDAARALDTANKKLSDDLKAGKATDDQKLQDIEAISQAAGAAAVAQLGPNATAQQTETANTNAQMWSLTMLAKQYPQMAPVIQPYLDKLKETTTAGDAGNTVTNNAISALGALATKYPELAAPIQALIDKIHAQDTAQQGVNNTITGSAISALGALAAKYPELSGQVQALIDKINAIPTAPHSTVTVDTSQASRNLDTLIAKFGVAAAFGAQGSLSGRGATQTSGTPVFAIDGHTIIGYKASGGSVQAGNPYWVGEGGGFKELFIPPVGGRILSHDDSMRAVQGSGVTINGPININVSGTGDPNAVGQAVATALFRAGRVS